ncbi:MAG: hypothetical protein J4215_00930 [Candidatus Diapherotrites archaeon]|uniref:Signal peptidase I n=1 Tax=Candidatus Iainarchaeum sp. TaxID=3101447 RepID=A0A8T4L3J5_9ARCH|nr:hypothetical protein [Candidatus Diapherotrites archaeon]
MDWVEFKERLKWLDPFTYSDLLVKRLGMDEVPMFRFFVEVVTAFLSAYVLYVALGFLLGTAMPIVIVVSGSMEPVLHRGDIVVLQGASASSVKAQEVAFNGALKNRGFEEFGKVRRVIDSEGNLAFYAVEISGKEIRFDLNGDTIVYFSEFSRIPVIHRAVLKIVTQNGTFILTKGDANPTFDQDCGRIVLGRPQFGCITPYGIDSKAVIGKQWFKIPVLGYVKLLIWDDVIELLAGCPRNVSVQGEYCAYWTAVGGRS